MKEHAIKFEMISYNSEIYCYLQVGGDLTHEDYEFFVPEFERSIQAIKEPHIKLLVDITALEGWDLHSVWDDLKFGFNHISKFDKIAVVGEKQLYEYGVKISNWFTPCEMEYFENLNDAKRWLF